LVRLSYEEPLETYSTNVLGTAHILEAVRSCPGVGSAIVITTDKCYQNNEWCWGYRENDTLGGNDPYSNSKACAELVTHAYRRSFFNSLARPCALASARAGNVIGGGDWAKDRLVPDCMNAILAGQPVTVRNPRAIRPWQHVLEPLFGYLLLAQKSFITPACFGGAYNFGPDDNDAVSVETFVKHLCAQWGAPARYTILDKNGPHEATYLKLDCSKAKSELGWKPHWNLDQTIDSIIKWFYAYKNKDDLRDATLRQIELFEQSICAAQ
jgi:CDP-glucose 4,6-dehydratase